MTALKVVSNTVDATDVWGMKSKTGVPVLLICDACGIDPVRTITEIWQAKRLSELAHRHWRRDATAISARWKDMSEAEFEATEDIAQLSKSIPDYHPEVTARAKAKLKRLSEGLIRVATNIDDLRAVAEYVPAAVHDEMETRFVALTEIEIRAIQSLNNEHERFMSFRSLYERTRSNAKARRLTIRAWAAEFPANSK